MICASCDHEIPDEGVICSRCSGPDPIHNRTVGKSASHRTLVGKVRKLKGLVLLSLMFGLLVAPFAIYVASRALLVHRLDQATDSSVIRQVIILRRIAVGLLLFWAFLVGARVAWLMAAPTAV